jgi:hypothetical protein
VHAPLRERGALELLERAGDFLVLARLNKPVLQHTAKPKVATFDENEELRGTRMNVRRVDAARFEETNGDADAETSRERVAFSGLSPADRCQFCKGS